MLHPEESPTLHLAGQDFDGIVRDELYNGHRRTEHPGVYTRVAPSFVRFGTAQIIARRQGVAGLVALARRTLRTLAAMEAVDDNSFVAATWYPLLGPGRHHPHALSVLQQCFFAATDVPVDDVKTAAPSASAVVRDSWCAWREQMLDDDETMACLLARVAQRTGEHKTTSC